MITASSIVETLKIYGERYGTECGVTVQSATVYDAKSGDELMEDITLTDFNFSEQEKKE